MIRKMMLQDWAIYENWESPEFATINDVYAANAAGKSTLIDAMKISLGLWERHYLFEHRNAEQYQRTKGQPSYILAWMNNLALPSGKRRFDAFGPTFSVLCRVDATHSPQVQYLLFDGSLDMNAAKDRALRKKWLRPGEYDDLWKRRGVSKDQRRQRVFNVGDTDIVRSSEPEELHALFREYCSDPELIEKQEEIRRKIASTKSDLATVDDALDSARREERKTQAEYNSQDKLKQTFTELKSQKQFLLVAKYVELEEDLTSERKGAERRKREQASLRSERDALAEQAKAKRGEEKTHRFQHKGEREKLANMQERVEKQENVAYKARSEQEALEKAATRLSELKKLDPTSQLAKTREQLELGRELKAKSIGVLENELETLRHNLKIAQEHGLPANVQACLDELNAKKIGLKPAWDFLPNDQPQGFEEAVGRNRFGLLVDPKDAPAVLALMREHDYPGPVSTLSQAEYQRLCSQGIVPSASGFEGPLGQYVVVHDAPYLNRKLVDEHVRSLRRRENELETKLKRGQAEAGRLATQSKEADEAHRLGLERDLLEEGQPSWKKRREDAERTLKLYDTDKDANYRQHEKVAELNAFATGAAAAADELEKKIGEINKQLEPQGQLTDLEAKVREARQECQAFLEARRPKVKSAEFHTRNVKTIEEELEGKVEPTKEHLSDLLKQVNGFKKTIGDLEEKLKTQEAELEKSKKDLTRIVDESLANESRAFARVKKNIEALGVQFNLPTRLQRRQMGDQWFLDYQVANRSGPDGLVFRPVKNSSDSTGEGVKASMIFLMGLSQPDQSLFYIFDEPAKNFSEDNVVDMFRIFQHTQSQVIISSAQRLDYGDGDIPVKQIFLQAEPKGTQNRKALPARHSLYGKIAVTA